MCVKLSDERSIPSVIAQMTLEEKALLVTGNSTFTTYPIKRLGIPSVSLLDGATGVNLFQLYQDTTYRLVDDPEAGFGGEVSPAVHADIRDHLLEPEKMQPKAQRIFALLLRQMEKRLPEGKLPGCFPPGMLLGATWDPETVYRCGSAVAKEMDAYAIDVVLGPNINIHRDPRNGRIYEGYAEDPCLAAALAPEFVKAIQDEGLVANAKHFAANNQETFRHNINEKISRRALHEIYFPAFKACVDAGLKSVMSAYNQINGKACTRNEWLLTDVLRKTWGFQGTVISDWHAVYDQVSAIRAGNDLDMPGKRDVCVILDAVRNGTLAETALDRATTNVLKMILQTPAMRGARRNSDIDRAYSRAAAYQAAAEGMVLLKNNGVLPLKKGTKLSFFGKRSAKFLECGSGSTLVQTNESTSLPAECEGYAGGISIGEVRPDTEAVIVTACAMGQEGSDRSGLCFEPGEHEMILSAIQAAGHRKKVLLLNISGPVDLRAYVEHFDAILCLFLPGMEGGRAAADILFGAVNPSGKLPITFPMRVEDVPAYLNFPGTAASVIYGEDIYIGYRYYDARAIKPMYPFGFGLSYTEFEISDLKITKQTMDLDADEEIYASVHVRNRGTADGKEVVQLYIADPASTLPKPPKELKAFRKVFLKAGESTALTFRITKQMLESYDEEMEQWVAETGQYRVLVGNASDNLAQEVELTAEGWSPYGFRPKAALIQFLMNPITCRMLQEQIEAHGWDFSKLDDSKQFYPEQPLVESLRTCYPFDADEPAWKDFFLRAATIPVGEFSFRNVADWTLENI